MPQSYNLNAVIFLVSSGTVFAGKNARLQQNSTVDAVTDYF